MTKYLKYMYIPLYFDVKEEFEGKKEFVGRHNLEDLESLHAITRPKNNKTGSHYTLYIIRS